MKKKLIWCIGPEGMGHHMCQAIFEDLWKGQGKFDSQFPQIIHYWNNMIEDNLQFFFNDILMRVVNSPYDTFVFTPSSPYDNPRDSLRRPDILEFYKQFSKVLDIKLIHLYRDPLESTYSLVRRGWFQSNDHRIKNQLLYQAKIVEDNLLYNKAHLEAIGKENWKTLHYETLVDNPKNSAEGLADLTELPIDFIIKGLSRVSKPHDRANIPSNYMSTLSRFFSKSRLNMWEDFFLSNTL
jgi:hypothetical protein